MARRKLPYHCALVTGASRGLGRAFSIALQAHGIRVLGTSRCPEGAGFETGEWLQLDLSDPHGVDHFCQRYERELQAVDLLINNAGAGIFGFVEKMDHSMIAEQERVLLKGPLEIFERLKRSLIDKQGAVVNVSSIAAEIPIPGFTVYSAMKAGLSQFTKGLIVECQPHGLQVVDLQLGDFQTQFNERTRHVSGLSEVEKRLWNTIETHLWAGADPDLAGRRLIDILAARTSGTFRVGGFFQTQVAIWGKRWLPEAWMRRLVRRYYGMS